MAGVIDFMGEKVKELAYQEVIFLCQIKTEIEKFIDRLKSMKAYAEDLGSSWKQENKVAEKWVNQLRENSIELEVLLEEFMLDMELLELNTPPCNFCEVKSLIATVQSLAKKVKMQICFHLQLKAIDTKLRDHEEERSRYNIQLNTNVRDNESLAMDRGYSQGFEAVGIDNEVKDMTDLIVNCRDCTVITIWGQGGSGKTTMAKQVYERVKDDGGFDCCSWGDVNHSSDIKYLLKTIINGLYKHARKEPPPELENADKDWLERHYLNYLQGKRYALFLDDVWDHNLLNKLRIQGGHASSIVITSRHRDIADGSFIGNGVRPHYVQIKPLEFDLACSLFCKAAFGDRSRTSAGGGTSAWPNNTIKEHGEELVRKCDGLPIAILAVGRLMFIKGDHPKQWRDALKNLDRECEGSLKSINTALLLSYDELPTHLKFCFLYCAIFPKTSYLPAKNMIHMCVAEGFVTQELHGKTPEYIARDYFLQLRNRSLLQIVPDEIDEDYERIEMHDLFRDLACLMFGREMFAEILDQNSIREPKQRRLVCMDNVAPPIVELVNCENVKLHTLIVANFNPFPQLLRSIKLLRVLVLEGLHEGVESLPNEVGDLLNLRYISLRRTFIRQLPDSLGRLHNLQTLDVEYNPHLNSLPECVSELTKLRHIFGTELQVPNKVFTFSQLQTLYGIAITPIQATELVNISNQLTKLKVEFEEEECWSNLRASTQQMGELKSLMILSMGMPLQFGNFSPPSQLEKLELVGFHVSARFTSIGDAAYLRSVSLELCSVYKDFFNCLGELPNLVFLSLSFYSEDKLECSDRSFPRLKSLWISFRVEKFYIGDGAMQYLQSLHLGGCQNLKVLPKGLGKLIDLKNLCLGDASQELIRRTREGGADHWKVKHIPRIDFE